MPSEKTWTTELIHYLNANWPAGLSAAFEVKYIKPPAKSFSLTRWLDKQPHQFRNLKLAGKKLVYKIADGTGAQTPFDIVLLSEAPGYLVLRFEDRTNKHFFMIESGVIDEIINLCNTNPEENGKIPLLTYEYCMELAKLNGVRMGTLGEKLK